MYMCMEGCGIRAEFCFDVLLLLNFITAADSDSGFSACASPWSFSLAVRLK
jgi:hypothetical protein